ncbi:MAG: efflux RND transporter periplasmic adaptor subunit [Ferruginibacter sp.]
MALKKIIAYTGLVSIVLLTACDNKKAEPPKAPPVVSVVLDTAKTTDEVYYDEYPATVTPLNQIDLRPQVSGFISGVHFKDGDRVKKGQLLYSIDEQLYAANYQQAVANLKVQEANQDKAQKDANRYHELDKNDAVAKQLVDNADAALEVAKKQSDASRATIRAVQTNVRYTKIYASFDGVIGISAVKVGTAVTAGQTLLNTVSSDKELAVDFNLDQKEIFRFTTLLNGKQENTDSTFRLAFGNDVYPAPGKLSLLDRTVNPQTGTIKARLIFSNDKNLLIAGMNGTVRVKANSTEKSIIIPYKAITEQLGEFFVYIPGDSDKVSQRRIVLGKQIGTNVIIKDGVKEGEVVVVQGVQNLKEGTVITTKPPAPPAANKPK